MAHNIWKDFFGIRLCWYLIRKKTVWKSLEFSPKWQFLYFRSTLAAIFVTIATIDFKYMPEFYTWTIHLINQLDEIDEKHLQFWALEGAKLAP